MADSSAGTYYYKVLVTNATHTNYAVVNQKFTVSDGSTTTTDKLSMTGGVTIPNIKVGNVVSIRGTVTSASSNLKSVTVGVYDSNNKLVTGKTVAPNAKTYNVRNLDAYVSFGDLKAGTYYHKVHCIECSKYKCCRSQSEVHRFGWQYHHNGYA